MRHFTCCVAVALMTQLQIPAISLFTRRLWRSHECSYRYSRNCFTVQYSTVHVPSTLASFAHILRTASRTAKSQSLTHICAADTVLYSVRISSTIALYLASFVEQFGTRSRFLPSLPSAQNPPSHQHQGFTRQLSLPRQPEQAHHHQPLPDSQDFTNGKRCGHPRILLSLLLSTPKHIQASAAASSQNGLRLHLGYIDPPLRITGAFSCSGRQLRVSRCQ